MGWVLIVIGPLLSAGVATLGWLLAGIINRPPGPTHLATYHGSHEVTVDTFLLLGSLFAFGLVSLAAGVYQVRHARRSKLILAVFFVVLAATIGSGIMASLAAQKVPASTEIHNDMPLPPPSVP